MQSRSKQRKGRQVKDCATQTEFSIMQLFEFIK